MKKLLFLILFLPFITQAQVVPAAQDTIRPSNIGASYTATVSDAMQGGILTRYMRRGTSSIWDMMITSKGAKPVYVPYTGSIKDIDLGIYGIAAQGFRAQGISGGIGAGYQWKAFGSTRVADWQMLELNSTKEFRFVIPPASGVGADTVIWSVPQATKIVDFKYNPTFLGAKLLTSIAVQMKLDSIAALMVRLTGAQTIAGQKTYTDNASFNAGLSIASGQSTNYNFGSWANWHYGTGYIAGDWRFQLFGSTMRLSKVGFIATGPVPETDDQFEFRGQDGIYRNSRKMLESGDVVGGNGIGITTFPNYVVISAIGNPVVEITGTSQTAVPNTVYINHNAALTTITATSTTTVGALYQVIGDGPWKLQLPAGFTAVGVGGFTTTAGGSLNSTDNNCTVTIRLKKANVFSITTSQGTLTPL